MYLLLFVIQTPLSGSRIVLLLPFLYCFSSQSLNQLTLHLNINLQIFRGATIVGSFQAFAATGCWPKWITSLIRQGSLFI